LETVPDLCTEVCLTASDDGGKDIKVEEGSYVSEEEDPLALTVPATKVEEEVSYVSWHDLWLDMGCVYGSFCLFSLCIQDSNRLLLESDRAALLETA
jgi:hypothetical protein